MNMSKIASVIIAAAIGAVLPAFAAEWFVSPTGSDSAAGTESAPWHTIQYAVGRAVANDTITLLPGDYGAEQGTREGASGDGACRVVVDKPLTIRSLGREYRDSTRIVGAWDASATSPLGMGDNAIRCVFVTSNAEGTRLEGISFCQGATAYNGNGSAIKSEGGGVYVANNTVATIVDCAFIDCQATRGGGLYTDHQDGTKVQAHRCLFKRCRDTKFGAGMRGGAAYNCVFDDCGRARDSSGETFGAEGSQHAMAYGHLAVNCTFVNCDRYGILVSTGLFGGGIYNCLDKNNGSSGILGASNTTTNCNVSGSANIYDLNSAEVVSPYDGDYRLIPGARALNAGDATYLSLVPEEFRGRDYEGNAFDTTGPTVHAGAVQVVASAQSSGIHFLADPAAGHWEIGGERAEIAFRTWKAAEGWPVPVKARFVLDNGGALVRYTLNQQHIWPLRDDSVWAISATLGQIQSLSTISATASQVFWADPVNGSDSNAGTEAAPFKTLNAAVQASTGRHVVYAKAGDYNSGSAATPNVGNGIVGIESRVVVPQTLAGELRVVAVDGPEATFITGAADANGTSYGLGANAVRCISVASTNANYAAFQGFTVRDGHTITIPVEDSFGGAMRNLNSSNKDLGTAFLLDCIVTNCAGARGGAVAGGAAYRCKFLNCLTGNGGGGVFRSCEVVSSLIDNCGGNSDLFTYDGANAFNCTIVNSSAGAVNTSSGAARLYNCVAGLRKSGFNTLNSNTGGGAINTLYDTIDSSVEAGTGSFQENPVIFASPALGDYRLAPDSAGNTLATTTHLKSCMDLRGNPFAFEDGRYTAGCFAAIEGRVLYVDAVSGSDANDGSSEASAFATLSAAIAAADYGDTVIALPGTYATGTAVPSLAQAGGSVEPTTASRVVVKSGVTLESRDGAAVTIIQGAASTAAGAKSGCGVGAVRGVFLCKNATLRGFTVTGGHTAATSLADGGDTMTVDNIGGGVCGYFAGDSASADEFAELVEDCVIANNVALRGAGAQYGIYRNCVFTNNVLCAAPNGSFKPGYALARANAEGCYFAGNGPSENHSTIYNCKVVNCTVMGGQAGANSSKGVICAEGNSIYTARPVLNSIILADKFSAARMTNCIIGVSSQNLYTGTLFTNNVVAADAKLDANGIPLAGSPATDAGDNALASAALLASRDPTGTRRVLNSTIDIGAYEYDWGVPWGAVIGNSRLVIDDMPSDAALSGNALVFGGSAVPVAMTWDKGGSDAAYTFNAQVTGAGTLTVTANDEPVATLTAANGSQAVSFASALANNALIFAYDGTEANGVILSAFSHQAPTMVIMR